MIAHVVITMTTTYLTTNIDTTPSSSSTALNLEQFLTRLLYFDNERDCMMA
jgi:hypothetical protein